MNKDAAYWVEKLGLRKHPEGGYFAETYRSAESIAAPALPQRYVGARPFGTAIYFLLCDDDFSAFHRLKSDEIWHFYSGTPLLVHMLSEDGMHNQVRLGIDRERGCVPQTVAPAGEWLAATLCEPRSYALVGCTVAPGFVFSDFELGERATLIKLFPQYASLIRQLTR